MSPDQAPILAYAQPSADSPSHPPVAIRVIALLISIPAIAIVFLEFAESTSPWNVVVSPLSEGYGSDWPLSLLGVPFFLAFPLAWLALRSLFSSRISLTELVIAWAIIGISLAATIVFNIMVLHDILLYGGGAPKPPIFMSITILVAGALLLIFRRRHLTRAHAPLIALYIAYLANATLCILGFDSIQNLGWYLTIPVAAVMIFLLLSLFPWRRMFRLNASA
jgi:hypothetical protein